jgi:beta-1,2-mannobiose phosphorylase / 1,2-beta-oligomannan phosphorylase
MPSNYKSLLVISVLLFSTPVSAQIPTMYYGDKDVPDRPFAKDPYVIFFKDKYWMYYSVPDANKKEWYIGIANSMDLIKWEKIANLKGLKNTVEEKGICAPGALIKDGKLHLFYQTYGNGKSDAICHAISTNGIDFERDATNPVFRPKLSDWSCGRAIDAEVVAYKNKYFLYYATRDPEYKIQQQGVAFTPINTNFERSAWIEAPNMPLLKPELPWETNCIEAASCIQKGKYLYMFYAGGYNNDPQQIGVAKSKDGIKWKRLSDQPLLKNGNKGSWNESESGHPNILKAQNGKYYLFFQGNNDKGKSWYLSSLEIGWNKKGPYLK